MLTLYRRHLAECPYRSRRYRRCQCPIWVDGSLRGEKIRRSLDLTSWEAASDLIAQWTAAGDIGMVKVEAPPIAEAVDKFLADARARHLGWESIRKYENLLQRRLLPWCDTRGLGLLKRLDIDNVRALRNTWKDGPVYASKKLERLRAFLRFCRDSHWINDNPALAFKPPQVADVPTLPFTAGEMKKILEACGKYRGDKGPHAGLCADDALLRTTNR